MKPLHIYATVCALVLALALLIPVAVAQATPRLLNTALPFRVSWLHIGRTVDYQTVGAGLTLSRAWGGATVVGKCAYQVRPVRQTGP